MNGEHVSPFSRCEQTHIFSLPAAAKTTEVAHRCHVPPAPAGPFAGPCTFSDDTSRNSIFRQDGRRQGRIQSKKRGKIQRLSVLADATSALAAVALRDSSPERRPVSAPPKYHPPAIRHISFAGRTCKRIVAATALARRCSAEPCLHTESSLLAYGLSNSWQKPSCLHVLQIIGLLSMTRQSPCLFFAQLNALCIHCVAFDDGWVGIGSFEKIRGSSGPQRR